MEDVINILKMTYKNIEENDVINKYKEDNIEINVYTTGIFKDIIEKVEMAIISENENIKLTSIDNMYYYEIIKEGKILKGKLKIEKTDIGNLNFILETEKLGNLTLQLQSVLENQEDMELININNSSSIKELTKDEQVIILENFKKSKLYNLIENILLKNEASNNE